jgi:hypothetical protein
MCRGGSRPLRRYPSLTAGPRCSCLMSWTIDGCVFRMLKGIDHDDQTSC